MWSQRKTQPLVVDVTDEALLKRCAPPTTCASCEQPAALMQMVGSAVAFCSECFAEMYALRT